MPPLRPLAFREVARKLERAGFIAENQRGSHVKFIGQIGERRTFTIVPRHREVQVKTLRKIIRQVGLTRQEFMDL